MKLPKARNDDELEKLTEELLVQLVDKFMQVKNELVRHDGDPSSWTWFYDERPYPLASSIIEKVGITSLEERDVSRRRASCNGLNMAEGWTRPAWKRNSLPRNPLAQAARTLQRCRNRGKNGSLREAGSQGSPLRFDNFANLNRFASSLSALFAPAKKVDKSC